MNPTVGSAASILGYNTWLFGNAVKDVQADKAGYRFDDNTNSFDRVAGHIVVARHGLASILGVDVPSLEWGDFADVKGPGAQFAPELTCPSLNDIASKFNHITESLMAKLPEVSEEKLAEPSPFPIPGDNPTVRDLLSFLAMHETYHLGQMGLLKKSMTGTRIMDQ